MCDRKIEQVGLMEKKPRILIMMHYMELGGAESALLGLLQSVDPERADVDVFIYSHRGELMEYIPQDRVRLLPEVEAYNLIERPMAECVKAGRWDLVLGRLWARWTVDKSPVPEGMEDIRIFSRVADCVERFVPRINPDVVYDLAISFLMPHNYVLHKVRAKKKIGWIHTDYSKVFVDVKREEKVWGQLDYIASISEDVGRAFGDTFPNLRNKIVDIENILNADFIKKRAEAFDVNLCDDSSAIKLLTIGRYSYPKKMEDIPTICRKVRDRGLDIKWFIIGYGNAEIENEIRRNAEREGVSYDVVLLGKQDNPYPYVKACDVYVQPSRYEGKSITVREAQIMGKPVIVTNYPTAASQVKDGVDGVIVPLEIEGCAAGMYAFIKDETKRKCVAEYLRTHDYGNEKEIDKIIALARS